jgi:hypothetical protein
MKKTPSSETAINAGPELSASEPDIRIAHILFIDVVGYSKNPMTAQREILDDFQRAVSSTTEYRRALNNGTALQ